ncbi:MAG: thiamine phosphate synthase [Alphaproteobacteria bacterium]|jgi:thiamine-phosphate pyrophosphorylase|nr:thiamine phosphate synthase [Alphaproteobacteria bacterium]
MTDRPRTRLYLITPPAIEDIDGFSDALMAALEAGDVACLQMRLKAGDAIDEAATRALADTVMAPVQEMGVAVVINDSPSLALELGADGVHVGLDDVPVAEARRILGPDAIVGATCKASRHRAMVAGEEGADYVAFGSFFPTVTKDKATPADPEILSWWQETMELPCVAIGGITVERAAPLVRAGADFLAVSSGVWNHAGGPAAAVAAFNTVFDTAGAADGN